MFVAIWPALDLVRQGARLNERAEEEEAGGELCGPRAARKRASKALQKSCFFPPPKGGRLAKESPSRL